MAKEYVFYQRWCSRMIPTEWTAYLTALVLSRRQRCAHTEWLTVSLITKGLVRFGKAYLK